MSAWTQRDVRESVRSHEAIVEIVAASDEVSMNAVLDIRRRVFAKEQGVPDLRVNDPDDVRSLNAIAWLYPEFEDDDRRLAVGTGRLTLSPFRGGASMVAWVATLPEYRGQQIGHKLMQFLLRASDAAGAQQVTLAAQAPAEHFYRRLGFITDGPRYDVRGIPHVRMVRFRNR